MEYVDFGPTGLRVSRLCFGTGTHGWGGRSEQTALGLDGLTDLLREAYDRGVNFWDAADAYGSHPHVARALKGLVRDAVVIATKTTSRSRDAVTNDIDRFLTELDTDVLDIVLLHYVTESDWPDRYSGAMDALSRAKDLGKVRAMGVSCHGLGPLRAAAETEWAEVVLVRTNYAGTNMDATPAKVEQVIRGMYHAGKALYGMKVLGCGHLAGDSHAAVRYVIELGTVHAVTIGTSSREQLLENVEVVETLAPQCPLRGKR